MLTIIVPGTELFNRVTQEFETTEETVLELEHSLASLSKWEETFKKPFLTNDDRTDAEAIGYIIAMTLTPDVPAEVYTRLSPANMEAIGAYMNDSKTATWFNERPGASSNKKTLTSELLYYYMYSHGIPKEHENDHLSRLFTLLRVFGEENNPQKPRPQKEMLSDRARINAERKAKMGITG